MNIFDDDPMFSLGRTETPVASAATASSDEVLRGDYWSLKRGTSGYELSYISGEMHGRMRTLNLTPDEGCQLIEGSTSVEAVLAKHGHG